MSLLTEEEKRILASVSVGNTDNGKLYLHQEEMLKQLRGCLDYLKEKYPDIEPVCRMFDPMTRISERGVLLFSVNEKDVYKAVITWKDHAYHFADTLYSFYVQERYDASLTALLADLCGSLRTHTVFHTPCGKEIGMDASAEVLNTREPVLVRHTDIYTEEGFETEKVIEILRKNRYFGSYTVFSKDQVLLNFNVGETEFPQEDA